MKILFILLLLLPVLVRGQCDNEFNTTVSPTYTWLPKGNALGVEIGATGDRSPLNLHFGVMMVGAKKGYSKKDTAFSGIDSRIYTKVGWRVLREEYLLSVYINGIGGMELQNGLLFAGSIKLLVPVGRSAISIEPIYCFQTDKLNVQAAVHFIL